MKETGKFRAHTKMGTDKAVPQQYREWHYSLVSHQLSSGVRRTRYAVSICDPQMNKAAYLRDFSTAEQATLAAHQWIDRILKKRLAKLRPGVIGTIPRLPTPSSTPTPTQEK